MNRTLRLVLLNEIPEDASLRQQWNTLAEGVDQPQIFFTYEWSLAVQRAYRSALKPLVFLAYEQNSISGVVALATDGSGKRASFLCATTGDYCDFLSSPEYKPTFVAAVLAELRNLGIGEVTLTNLSRDSGTVAAISALSNQNGFRCFTRTAYVCAQVSLGKIERRPSDNTLQLPRRKRLRQYLRAMEREGPVRLEHARAWETAGPLLPQFIQSHVARFEAAGRISNMVRPERQTFLEELAKLLAESGWFTLTRLLMGDRAVAWNYGFQFRGTWFWYQPTFDIDLDKYSPGFCLLSMLIEEAAEDRTLQTVDLGLGDEGYKGSFANQSRETLYVTLRASLAQHLREILRYRAVEILKTAPRLEAAIRRMTGRTGSVGD